MRVLLLSVLLFLVAVVPCLGQVYYGRIGDTQEDVGRCVLRDPLGNSYFAGRYRGTVDLDPGPGIFSSTSQGSDDIFIVKLGSNGNLAWAISMGGTQSESAYDMAFDPNGNLIVIGYFGSTMDFDPGQGIFSMTSAGSNDIFLQKLDPSGNFLWARKTGGSGTDWGLAVSTDPSGYIYATGSFTNSADLDPHPSTTLNLTSAGARDIFVQKLNSSGDLVWVQGIGSISDQEGFDIIVDQVGSVFVVGYFGNTVDFDSGTGVYNLTSVGTDGFVLKLDAAGNFAWAAQVGGQGNIYLEACESLRLDSQGNVIVVGEFMGTTDFDPGPGTYSVTSGGQEDMYVLKWSGTGNFVWAKTVGGIQSDYGWGVDIDGSGNIYVVGAFGATVDFDPSSTGSYLLSAMGANDVSITKLDSTGNLIWAQAIGGPNFEGAYDVAVGSTGAISLIGVFQGIVDFDPGIGTYFLSSAGDFDAFMTTLGHCSSSSFGSISHTGCQNSYTLNGHTYTVSGSFNQVLPNANVIGCDSVITLSLMLLSPSSSTVNASSCMDYTLNGQTYTASGTYTQTLTNVQGCDSVITLNLTIHPAPSFSLGPDTAFCPDTTWLLAGPALGSWLWSTGAVSASVQVGAAGTYWLAYTDPNGCVARDTIVLSISTDCVWPGDANHDGIADNLDLLAVGYGFGFSGTVRAGASPTWYGQPAASWGTSLPSGVNHKHADCNGDGTIGYADTTLIVANYGLTHNKTTEVTTGVPLMIVPEQDSFPVGDTVFFRVQWGDGSQPVVSGHGLAFGFHIDPQQVMTGSLFVRYPSSFLASSPNDLVTLTYPVPTSGDCQIAMSRMDRTGQTGVGDVLRVGFLPDAVIPLTSTLGYVPVQLMGSVAVDADFNPIQVSVLGDSVLVYSSANAVTGAAVASWHVFPNPTAGDARLEIDVRSQTELEVYLVDLQGRRLATLLESQSSTVGVHRLIVPTAGLSQGVYFVHLLVEGRSLVQKLVVER